MEFDNNPYGHDHAMSSPFSSPPPAHSSSEKEVKSSVPALQPLRVKGTLNGPRDALTLTSAQLNGTSVVPTPIPKPRKKRVSNAAAATATKNEGGSVKEKKPRQPRDPNKPPRKKQKLATTSLPTDALFQHSTAGGSTGPARPQLLQKPSSGPQLLAKPVVASVDSLQHLARPTSGQRYDPIRSSYEEHPAPATNRSSSHARSTPSIASLIDHPVALRDPPTSYNLHSHLRPLASALDQPREGTSKHPSASTSSRAPPSSSVTPAHQQSPMHGSTAAASPEPSRVYSAGRSVTPHIAPKPEPVAVVPAPKPSRPKAVLPPLPLAGGLLSGAGFKKADSVEREYEEVPNQCIVIEVPMTKESGNYVNFMKEVEQKYGFDVAHPRLAEHRKRMKQMAAAGAALESGSGSGSGLDDLPIELSDAESNAEMGGVDEDSGAFDGKKKKRAIANAYDKDDDFIDDTELMWEEQALASNDGYFVWSGPLIPEADKPTVERPDGTVKRGRAGRARGGATRGDASARGKGTGAARGARGGTTVRKPRVTKADRAKFDVEKQERLKLSATAPKPAGIPEMTA